MEDINKAKVNNLLYLIIKRLQEIRKVHVEILSFKFEWVSCEHTNEWKNKGISINKDNKIQGIRYKECIRCGNVLIS